MATFDSRTNKPNIPNKATEPKPMEEKTVETTNDNESQLEIKSRYTDPNYGSIRKMGRNVSRDEGKAITFYSINKNMVLYANEECFIEFKNFEYKTDNEFDIDFIRKSPLFGRDVFEGQYPTHVLEMFKQRSKDFHDTPEEANSVMRG